MTQFPDAKRPPTSVDEARKSRICALRRSILFGITARGVIVFLEMAAFFLFGSEALFMDALSTLLDISSSLILFFFIKLADRPPDQNHPFGHGRYEPLAGMQLGIFLALVGVYMAFRNLIDLRGGEEGHSLPPFLFVVPLFAIILLEISYRFLMRTARSEASSALVAEAAHFRVDAITSILAMLSLISGQLLPQATLFLDHLGAVLIAAVMVFLGLMAARENLHQLLDRVPENEVFERIRRAAMRAKGVLGTEKIRVQQFGPDAHVDIDIEVEPTLSVDEAHKISQEVRVEIQKDWPSVQDVIVHIEPYYQGDH
ncbi:cation diffusion facilitator family transporter [Estrella lausannensis]|uniref:Cation efflux transporter n=1 Tax=Estrella lausannensis TaxID=483423 RepID=A0A0H5DNV6_9BACT|nr:cation diffusion facilitator family transporter [Estrella lausannensis]CRX38081.1 Cation efflux transporter [Estrella lausannensis]